MVNIIYAMGPRRPEAPGPGITKALENTARIALGEGSSVRITSGTGEHGSVRHRGGHAADVQFLDPQGRLITLNDPRARYIAIVAAQNGITGLGAGVEYMGNSTFHMDIYPVAPYTSGMARAWGSWGHQIEAEFVAAYSGGSRSSAPYSTSGSYDNPLVQNDPFRISGVAAFDVSLYSQEERDLLVSFDLFRRARENMPELVELPNLLEDYGDLNG